MLCNITPLPFCVFYPVGFRQFVCVEFILCLFFVLRIYVLRILLKIGVFFMFCCMCVNGYSNVLWGSF